MRYDVEEDNKGLLIDDMSRIIASLEQRKCRELFKKAVAYAKEVIADEQRKRDWQKCLRRCNGVYNEAVKYFMLKDKRAKEAAMLEAKRLIRRAFAQTKKAEFYIDRDASAASLLPCPGNKTQSEKHAERPGSVSFLSG